MDQPITFKEKLEVLLRRKEVVLVSAILGGLIGIYLAKTIPPAYRSSTLIMVEKQQMPQTYVMPTDVTPIEKRLSTISEQIMSRTRLEKIIEDFNLYRVNDSFLWVVSHGLIDAFRDEDPQWKTGKEGLVEKMRKDIEIKALGEGARKGDAFSISYSSDNPNSAMQVTNTLASLFIQENMKTREEYAEDTIKLLTNELETAKNDLESQDRAIKTFKDMYMGRLPEQMDANLKTIDRLQTELTSVQTSLKSAEERKALLEDQISDGYIKTSPSKVVSAPLPLEAELENLNKELASLLSLYTENYPDVAITRGRIREVKRLLAESSAASTSTQETTGEEGKNSEYIATIANAKSQIAALKHQEAGIREQIETFRRRVEGTPAVEQMMANMMRDYEASKKNYQALLEKKMNAKLAENMEKGKNGDIFRVIDTANLPEKPYKPKKFNIAFMGLLGGTGVGVGLAFMLEFMNPVFRRPEDFIGVINKPVLASIPVFSKKRIAEQGAKPNLTKAKAEQR